jgi:hypothetical protein
MLLFCRNSPESKTAVVGAVPCSLPSSFPPPLIQEPRLTLPQPSLISLRPNQPCLHARAQSESLCPENIMPSPLPRPSSHGVAISAHTSSLGGVVFSKPSHMLDLKVAAPSCCEEES